MQVTDAQQMNNQIFSKSTIQVSPQHLQMLNMKPPTLFKPNWKKGLESTGYKVFLTGYAEHVLKQEVVGYREMSLNKLIDQLSSLPRPVQNGYQMKGSPNTQMVSSTSHNVWYKVVSGQIIVFNIEILNEAQNARDRLEKPGLYKIKKTGQGNWIKEASTRQITTKHAAINGMQNNLNKATWLMGAHLDHEYGSSGMKEYTLFHNPSVGFDGDLWESVKDKFGFTTGVTEKFSKVLQESQKAGNEIKWVAHSQGGLIFAEAVRYFLNGNSSWALLGGFNGIFKDKEKVDLSHHKVAFHGNANNNIRSKLLFDRAGIEVVSTKVNDYDLVGNVLGANTLNPRKIVGSIIYANHLSGSVAQSPHTLSQSQESWDKNMTFGPGKGRGSIQKGFETTVRYINNFLK